MASFGSFETDREIYSGPTYTIYSARKSGDPKTEYAVKVFSIHRLGLEPESATQLESLISDIERSCHQCIAVQQQAASASDFVTPIFESGQDERGVWYATRFFPRSVNKIITGRVALNRDALEHIIRSITQGAVDIKRACGRSHGDILPSNVQISRSEKLAEAEVVLSDPMPGDAAEAGRYELSDLRSIGRILLQLVLQRQISHEEDSLLILPILVSPGWTRLFGKDADRWLLLCNRLLDQNLSLEQLTLDKLVEELEQLRSKPPISQKAILTGVAVCAALVVVAIVAAMHFKRGNLSITTDPPGAEIYLEVEGKSQLRGKTRLDETPLPIKRMPKGLYHLLARFDGLSDQTTNVTIEGGKTQTIRFHFPYGQVRITSSPANAEVILGRKAVGLTPYSNPFLAPGTQSYTVRLTGYYDAGFQVVVPSNRLLVSVETNLIRMKSDDGIVDLLSLPSGATIKEGTNTLGQTPRRTYLSAGRHTITAQFQDWNALTNEIVTNEIVVVAGVSNPPVNVSFPYGIAAFYVDPPDAKIYLNNNLLGGEGDVRRKPFPPGDYAMRASHAGYKPSEERKISIPSQGMTTNVLVKLEAMDGLVVFTTDPPGAIIFDTTQAQEKQIGRTTEQSNTLPRRFKPGSYTFIARYEGLGLDPVQSKPVQVGIGTSNSLPLRLIHGTVQFVTEPSGADVVIAGRAVGKTPYNHYQKPGPVAYSIQMADYNIVKDSIDSLQDGRTVLVSLRLRPMDVDIDLRSDPSGAQFYLEDKPLRETNGHYALPWGSNRVTARLPLYPALEAVTELVSVKKNEQNSHEFNFHYGSVILTNLPDEIIVKEGNDELPSAPGLPRVAYVRPGPHSYDFYDGDEKITNFTANVQVGTSMILPKGLVPEMGGIKNSIDMRLVKVRDLLGKGKEGWVGRYEVTQWEFQRVMGTNPSVAPLGSNYPVQNVTWDQATEFCRKLRASDEKKPPRIRGEYRLPTKEQWLFLAKGTSFKDAVIMTNAPSPVGSKPANANHLNDVLGNVWEWLGDEPDPVNRFFIGGGYNLNNWGLQFDRTGQHPRTYAEALVGFRVMLVPASGAAAAR